MAEMLLINPRKRRKSRKAASPAQRRARAKFAAMARGRRRNLIESRVANPKRRRTRRRNPISTMRTRQAVRSNPRRVSRRRRNPITLRSTTNLLMKQVQDAIIGAGGALGMDFAMAQLGPMLPATLQTGMAAKAVKAVATVVLGQALRKITRGLSTKAALGALTVQAHGVISEMLPPGVLGFYSPAPVIPGVQRVGPIRKGVNAYTRPGMTPLLNSYMRPGVSPLLSGMGSSTLPGASAREREGVWKR